MNDETQVALLFSVDEISNYNLKLLAPQGVVIGSVSDDTTKFYSSTSNAIYENADEAVRSNNKFCFYYVKTIKDLKNKYKVDDLNELIKCYLNDSYDKVYYYDNINSDKFEDCFLKNCSISEFNKKYKLKFKYSTKTTADKEAEDYYGGFFRSIKDNLDTSLLFQDGAKKQVISTLYNNFLYNNANSHIILSGPSGVGKTKFLKILSSSDVYPSLYVDFSPDACDSPKDYLNSILINYYYVQLSMNKVDSPGIIMIDNIDNINYDYDYDLLEFSDELKQLLTTNKRIVPYSENSRTGVVMDPGKITFIICGRFDRAKKCKEIPNNIFKSKKIDTSKIPVTLDKYDLLDRYDLTEKFLDLFDVRVNMNSLSFNKAKNIILNSADSPLRLYCDDLAKQGIEVRFTDETLDRICKLSYSHDTNLKKMDSAIKSVFNDIILNSQISSGSKINLNIGGNQYKKGSKK